MLNHYIIAYYFVVVVVNITGVSHRVVNESSGAVEICVTADHESRRPFSVTITTYEGSATGEVSSLKSYKLYCHVFISIYRGC